MLLFLNKQFRTEEKIVSELIKKIKKSKTIHQNVVGNKEIYSLDGFDICFETTDCKFVVTDKDDKKIVAMDCHYDPDDEMQEARANWFYELENVARECYDKKMSAREKQSKWKRGTNAVSAAAKMKQAQTQHNSALKALQRVKKL